jgi:hypothetical protein
MRYPAAEKLETIRPVEQSALPVRRTLAQLGIPRATVRAVAHKVIHGATAGDGKAG